MSGTSLEPDESQDIKFYHAHDDNDIWRWYSLSFTVWVKLKCRIKENGSRSAPKANRAWLHLTLGRSRFRLTKTSEMHTRCIKCTKTSKNHPAQRLSKLQWRFIASHRIICHTTCQQCRDIVECRGNPWHPNHIDSLSSLWREDLECNDSEQWPRSMAVWVQYWHYLLTMWRTLKNL